MTIYVVCPEGTSNEKILSEIIFPLYRGTRSFFIYTTEESATHALNTSRADTGQFVPSLRLQGFEMKKIELDLKNLPFIQPENVERKEYVKSLKWKAARTELIVAFVIIPILSVLAYNYFG